MRPLNLKEFAEDMRRKGDIRDADLADEILALARHRGRGCGAV
jgi:hypothetical protein